VCLKNVGFRRWEEGRETRWSICKSGTVKEVGGKNKKHVHAIGLRGVCSSGDGGGGSVCKKKGGDQKQEKYRKELTLKDAKGG